MVKRVNKWDVVICIASGPSLTAADCNLAAMSGLPVIAVNNSWQAIPNCDVVFAGDWSWWYQHHDQIVSNAERWTVSCLAAARLGINRFTSRFMRPSWNSGMLAIELAVSRGARRVWLLGYDCSLQQGSHWHGDHARGMKNPDKKATDRWQNEFMRLQQGLPGVTVVNCSRSTALSCFPRQSPEAILLAVDEISVRPLL
jgi:hypothetical protein